MAGVPAAGGGVHAAGGARPALDLSTQTPEETYLHMMKANVL